MKRGDLPKKVKDAEKIFFKMIDDCVDYHRNPPFNGFLRGAFGGFLDIICENMVPVKKEERDE